MEIKKSKVKNVQATGTWDSQHGTLYKFEYTFEDGVTLTANHKKADGNFQIGTEVEYEIKNDHPEYGKSGTVKKPESNDFKGSGGRVIDKDTQVQIVRQNALGHATELLKYNSGYAKEPGIINADHVIALADKYATWVLSKN